MRVRDHYTPTPEGQAHAQRCRDGLFRADWKPCRDAPGCDGTVYLYFFRHPVRGHIAVYEDGCIAVAKTEPRTQYHEFDSTDPAAVDAAVAWLRERLCS